MPPVRDLHDDVALMVLGHLIARTSIVDSSVRRSLVLLAHQMADDYLFHRGRLREADTQPTRCIDGYQRHRYRDGRCQRVGCEGRQPTAAQTTQQWRQQFRLVERKG